MDWPLIQKAAAMPDGPPNLPDYAAAVADFTWEQADADLAGLPGGGLNIGHETVDRHAAGPNADGPALCCLALDGTVENISWRRLRELTNRFANVLDRLGVGADEPVASLLGSRPELHLAVLGSLKHRSVFCPLYAAFGPEPIRIRLNLSRARVLLTTPDLFRRRIEPQWERLPHLQTVLLVDAPGTVPDASRCLALDALLAEAGADFRIPPTRPEDPALLHFTSGTTGTPKGVMHVHDAVRMHRLSARLALDIRAGDRVWCTADPGWVTGISYGVIAPLALGASLLVDEAPFDAERWYRILAQQRINVWYTSPTAIRLLMGLGPELPRRFDTAALRFMASVGEPLNPGAVTWGREALGLPFHDTWWQTETGAILIANYRSMAIKPGSMGRPLPGIAATIMQRRADGVLVPSESAEACGELAIRRGWPSMFRAYLDDAERYARCFAGDWYLTGDLARRDADGYFWFVGRKDDLIKSSGHLIGPFEVENVLLEHPAVAEAAVIGKPDPTAMEIVKAFVALQPGHMADEGLRRDILAHARRRLGAVVAPKELVFRDRIPKTRSGKILRRLLKAEETGEPPGDLSTLDEDLSPPVGDPP